ncbi:helix-turn-helix domain-containing protein [Chitinophaga nivalis]|uniref:Helix-turn-helix domain-containing protein n=1 Tax=Chitinophaga nivalis TaxID=2991709 RepID=A0ABT3IMK9_9BACT|nr:helix-turn-helix domain-containing protein [Chitinophaga nivalis]MCW3465100.1 helix-turn-helix domain-containing protein [Chitinophaga nivalis]MCW3485208.1 helix-turn-helix domain-containing protein [Chitinophaga nivalis]
MKSKVYKPHPALQDFVSCISIYGADFTQPAALSNIYRFVPAYQRYIIFYLEDPISVLKQGGDSFETKAPCVTIGPQEQAVTLDMGRKHLALCIAFKASGLFRLLKIPMTEMFEKDFDTQLLLGNQIPEIYERLKAAADWDHMIRIVEQYLLKMVDDLKPSLPVDMALHELVKNNGAISMDELASLSCLSLRQFERKCQERLGMPPKQYARLIRFCKAYQLKEQFPDKTWTEIAYKSGYYDQMHFIRDFKKFAGITPSFIHEEDLISTIRLHSVME